MMQLQDQHHREFAAQQQAQLQGHSLGAPTYQQTQGGGEPGLADLITTPAFVRYMQVLSRDRRPMPILLQSGLLRGWLERLEHSSRFKPAGRCRNVHAPAHEDLVAQH